MIRIPVLSAILFCAAPFSAHAGVENLICEETGIAGIAFGQRIEEEQARLVEAVGSGVAYFALVPQIDIAPFAKVVVGVTPRSRRVFSVSLEVHGGGPELDGLIESFKVTLNHAHAEISWTTIGNHHYGEQALNVNVSLYRIGDFVDGDATNLLSYDCESRALRQVLFDELS